MPNLPVDKLILETNHRILDADYRNHLDALVSMSLHSGYHIYVKSFDNAILVPIELPVMRIHVTFHAEQNRWFIAE